MDEEEENEEYEDTEVEIDCRPIRLIDLILLPVCFIQLCAEAASTTLEALVRMLAGHRNFLTEQQAFAAAVREEIETIPSTEE